MYFAFSPQCSQSPGLHSPISRWFHHSSGHLLAFSLTVTADKSENWVLLPGRPGDVTAEDVHSSLWEATKLLELMSQVSPWPPVVYFDSISFCGGRRIHALEWTPNANLSPFSPPVWAKRGFRLYILIAFPSATTAGCCPRVLSPPPRLKYRIDFCTGRKEFNWGITVTFIPLHSANLQAISVFQQIGPSGRSSIWIWASAIDLPQALRAQWSSVVT